MSDDSSNQFKENLDYMTRKIANDIISDGFSTIRGNLMGFMQLVQNQSSVVEPPKLSGKELSNLRWVIKEASSLRGQFVGHEEAQDHLDAFDNKIVQAEFSMRKISDYMRRVKSATR